MDRRSAAAWSLAAEQLGLIARRDLLALGFSAKEIRHRLATGRLHAVARGVYAVGWPQLTTRQRWMAAVLACGDDAAISHRSAAALWGIRREVGPTVDVSVRRRSRLRRPGVRARSRIKLPGQDVTRRDGIPVTTPARTLVDLASEAGALELERAVNDADKRDLIDPEQLRAALGHFRGEPGVRALRALRFTHGQIKHRPRYVQGILAQTARRLGRAGERAGSR